jgi:hypothetical protein
MICKAKFVPTVKEIMPQQRRGSFAADVGGYVTDTYCGTNCQVSKDMTPNKKCVDRCVRKGSKYGLWVDRHVYVLEPQNKAARYAADVSVTGTLDGETIHIESIAPNKRAANSKPKN